MNTTPPPGPPTPAPLSPAYAQRPAQAVKSSYASSWLHFLIVICLLVAWWFPAKYLLGRLLWPGVPPAPRDAYSFVALVYEGVSDKPNEVSPAQFAEHLQALRDAGYAPIRLTDVEALVREGKPVPRKAILLTFDHARKTSYFAVHALLRRAGWNAVMFLWTKPIEDRDNAAVLWPYLRSMMRSRVWELGAQSHDAFRRHPIGSQGQMGNFMTAPLWLTGAKRYETLDEFQARLEADHEACLALLKKRLGLKPIAYAYPFGDFGQYQSRAVIARPINLALVDKHYSLGFLSGNLAANTRYSDPRRLNRLLVNPRWSGKDLLAYLDKSWPDPSRHILSGSDASSSAWIVDWGLMDTEPSGGYRLHATPTTTGAKMWLAGSDLNRDYYARVKFRLDRGQLGLFLRASSDGESYVYVGIDAGGEVWLRQMARGKDTLTPDVGDIEPEEAGVWLRQKNALSERFTLASSRVSLKPDADHSLEIFLRDKLLFAHVDGREIFRSRNMLRGELKPGLFGLAVWSPEPGAAQVLIREVELNRQTPQAALWATNAKREPYVFKWLYANAYRLTQISPVWMRAAATGQSIETEFDARVYRLLAQVNHLKFFPQVVVDDERLLSRITPGLLADRAVDAEVEGVCLNLSNLRNPEMATLATWVRNCGQALQEKKVQLQVQLPEVMQNRSSIQSLLAVVPNAGVVVNPDSAVKDDPALQGKTVVTAEKVPEPGPADELPLYFVLPGIQDTPKEETIELRINRLQQEGLAAYLDGKYDQAESLWKEWLSLDPENPRAMSLVGDACVRQGNLPAAADYYGRSLEADPGQVALALRRVDLYRQMGQTEEAIQSLNLYARLFPDNVDILLAQTRWLTEEDREAEARRLLDRVLQLSPENLTGLAMQLKLTDDPAKYMAAMAKVAELGRRPEMRLEFGQALWKYELLALPHTDALWELTRQVAAEETDPRIKEIFLRVAPNNEVAVETLPEGRLSSRWWVDGGTCVGNPGEVVLASTPAYTEARLRLLGSMHLRNAFVEATVSHVRGSFWVYTGRTQDRFCRFGFNGEVLTLQAWRGGRLIAERKRPWTPPPDQKVTLRIEMSADGLMGYLNGEPVTTSRLHVAEDLNQGWLGAAVFNATRGQAAATIHRLAAGPLAPRLAVLEPVPDEAGLDRQLANLRTCADRILAMCPTWYAVENTGKWTELSAGDKQTAQVFARYYRMWLLPLVDVKPGAVVHGSDLQVVADRDDLKGFLLLYRDAPSEEAVRALRRELQSSQLRVLIVVSDPAAGVARVRAAGTGPDVFGGSEEVQELKLLHGVDPSGLPDVLNRDGPVLIGF